MKNKKQKTTHQELLTPGGDLHAIPHFLELAHPPVENVAGGEDLWKQGELGQVGWFVERVCGHALHCTNRSWPWGDASVNHCLKVLNAPNPLRSPGVNWTLKTQPRTGDSPTNSLQVAEKLKQIFQKTNMSRPSTGKRRQWSDSPCASESKGRVLTKNTRTEETKNCQPT